MYVKKDKIMKYFYLLTAAAVISLGHISAVVAGPYTNLYVFGDSLVDAGNVQLGAVSLLGPAADPAPADAGYFNGRFGNGPVYVDLLNQQLFGSFSRASLTGGNNFSYGGAKARADADQIPDLQLQVGSYFARSGGTAEANALYVINTGGNDLFAAAANPTLLPTFKADSIDVITAQVTALNAAGARNILVTGLPNVGRAPRIAGNPAAAAAARALSVNYDAVLQSALDGLMLETGTKLFRFNYIGYFDNIINNLSANGLPADLNLTTPCTVGEPKSSTPDCSKYAFFDLIHPEARLQRLVFNRVAEITGVPEPVSMSLLGIGLMTLIARRHRQNKQV
jgi:outer membrane lipase/esterase